jgi:hypothetical protein
MTAENRDLGIHGAVPENEHVPSSVAYVYATRVIGEMARTQRRMFELTGDERFAAQVESLESGLPREMHAELADYSLTHRELVDSEIYASFDFSAPIENYLIANLKKEDFLDNGEMHDYAVSLAQGLKGMMVSGISAVGDSMPQVNSVVQSIDRATALAAERGVSVESVYQADELFLELQRRMKSQEETVNFNLGAIRKLRTQEVEGISKAIVTGFVQNFGGMDDEDRADAMRDLEEDPDGFPALGEFFKSMLPTLITVTAEGIERVWGLEAANEFLTRVAENPSVPESSDSN